MQLDINEYKIDEEELYKSDNDDENEENNENLYGD